MSHGMRRCVVDYDGWILFSSVDGAIFVDVRRYPTRRRAMWDLPPVSAMDLSWLSQRCCAQVALDVLHCCSTLLTQHFKADAGRIASSGRRRLMNYIVLIEPFRVSSYGDKHILFANNNHPNKADISLLSRRVYKSKCVTCVFEVANAGLVVLMEDILAEFKRWFVGKRMIGLDTVFIVPHSSDGEEVVIGRVSAVGSKRNALSHAHYYLLPKCTSEYEQFSIDDDGTITFRRQLEKPPPRIQLCVLASNHAGLKTTNMTFESKNASMIRTVVIFDEKTSSPQIPVLQNNTVTVIQEGLRSTSIPVADSKGFDRGVRYSIDHVKFTASQNSTKLPTAGSSLFFVEPITGEVGVNPLLTDNPQGVYSVVINASSTTLKEPLFQLVKKFHYVKNDMKMRFVFDMTPEEFAVNREQFMRKSTLSLLILRGHKAVVASRTSVCFHVTMAEEIQNKHSAMSALSTPKAKKSELSRLYNLFKVINIASCSDPVSSLQQSIYQVSMHVLLLVVSVIILIIMLTALLIYICFIRRYKEHLRMKKKQVKVAEGTLSPMNFSQTFILPPIM
ncbi:unnamed protein product [Angiostrongylus costaricensis]|uniref:Cadherin domain-containing protein n=1 Tax=Angiostrongylus costaricensis TaxID=334426 RepID=A0A158PE77_ANGCS|nr:unnamed protein product [Angiostrongylus costaricensis]